MDRREGTGHFLRQKHERAFVLWGTERSEGRLCSPIYLQGTYEYLINESEARESGGCGCIKQVAALQSKPIEHAGARAPRAAARHSCLKCH